MPRLVNGLEFSLPKIPLYLPPTSQSSWSRRPFHVSLSSSLWTDLLLVAILFRLNEFCLAQLTHGMIGFWFPVALFFAVYDIWEHRVLFDSVFRFEEDFFHNVVNVIQWLLLALLATSITPSSTWSELDAILFSTLKVCHQTIRIWNYVETALWSKSARARKAAHVRAWVFIASWPLYLSVPILIGSYHVDPAKVVMLYVIGFFVQRIVWMFLRYNPSTWLESKFQFSENAKAVKPNVPFKTQRYADWSMLQLGAIILGFMTVPTTTLEGYGTLIWAYSYVAFLILLTYSMAPEDPNNHASVKGGVREFIWLELFSLGGVAYVGLAAGLRMHVFYPGYVILDQNRHYTWLLCGSATVAMWVLIAQEMCHGGVMARWNGGAGLWLKITFAGLYMLVGGAVIASGVDSASFVTLGLAIVTLAILILDALNGAFRRQIMHNHKVVLMGHFRAAAIGMVLLIRVRRRLRQLNQIENDVNEEDDYVSPIAKQKSLVDGEIHRGFAFDDNTVLRKESSKESLGGAGGGALYNMGGADASTRMIKKRRSSMDQRALVAKTIIIHTVALAKKDATIVKHLLNERIYSPPKIHPEGHKATKYKVQWVDLFFDVLYVGIVFRLGDFLLAGMGGGYEEVSVHFLNTIGEGTNITNYQIPIEPNRADAVWLFGTMFISVWSMWQNKLAFSSKVGHADVVHKVVDLFQGLCVLLCGVNITSPYQMEHNVSGHAYAVAGSLLAFQMSLIGLWIEVLIMDGKTDSRAKGTAQRNIYRDSISVIPLLCSFGSIYTNQTLALTTFLWCLSWFIPFVLRIYAASFVTEHNAVRDLHRYVIHRLGDAALIVLGEGVMQIIRSKTVPAVYSYLTVTLALFVMSATRITVWSMDCFTDPSKHAQLLDLNAGLGAYFIRSVAAPAFVSMGVSLKKLISVAAVEYSSANLGYYWMLTGSSTVCLFTLVVTYELHRWSYFRSFRKMGFTVTASIAFLFLIWTPVPAPGWVIVALCLFVWSLAIVVHYLLDDYFLLKEGKRDMEESRREMHVMKGVPSSHSAKTFQGDRQFVSVKLSLPFTSSPSARKKRMSNKKQVPGLVLPASSAEDGVVDVAASAVVVPIGEKSRHARFPDLSNDLESGGVRRVQSMPDQEIHVAHHRGRSTHASPDPASSMELSDNLSFLGEEGAMQEVRNTAPILMRVMSAGDLADDKVVPFDGRRESS